MAAAKQFLEQMAKPDLVFLTAANQGEVMEEIRRQAECDAAQEPQH